MAVKYRTKHGKREGKHTVVMSNTVMYERDAVDTQRKTALTIFTASNGPQGWPCCYTFIAIHCMVIMGWQTRHTHKQWICLESIEILRISWTPPPIHCETTRHSSQDVEQEKLNTTPWIHWNCSPTSGESPLTKQTQSHKASNYWDPIWTLTKRGLGRGHWCIATRRGSPH